MNIISIVTASVTVITTALNFSKIIGYFKTGVNIQRL